VLDQIANFKMISDHSILRFVGPFII